VEKFSTASHSAGEAGVAGQSGLWAGHTVGLAQAWMRPCYPGEQAPRLWGPTFPTCV